MSEPATPLMTRSEFWRQAREYRAKYGEDVAIRKRALELAVIAAGPQAPDSLSTETSTKIEQIADRFCGYIYKDGLELKLAPLVQAAVDAGVLSP